MRSALPWTTIVIPTLNEAEHIAALVARLLPARGEGPVGEVIVADGGSTDGTVAIVERLAASDGRIRLLHNPARVQSAGINAAVAVADPAAEVILRVDAHARYAADFVDRVVGALERVGADSVVVRLDTTAGRGPGAAFQRAVAAALNSRVGSGNSAHRVGGASGFVDHGHHAAFRRSAFSAVGGYDEKFVANEDAELDARLRASGRRIWFENEIVVSYYPRRTPRALVLQYWRYGVGRAQTFLKHRERLHVRQAMPPALCVSLAAALLAGVLVSGWFLAVPLLYLGTLTAVGAAFAWREGDAALLLVPSALAIVHVTWGAGFLAGIAQGSRRLRRVLLAAGRRPAGAGEAAG
jgi:succinoglycan biosynthesis protein ExoA